MIAHKLFALYAAALFALASIPQAGAQTPAATTTVSSFYRWYFAGKADWTRFSGARAYLSPSLYSALQSVVDAEKRGGGAVLDFDPFTGAQEPAQSYRLGTPVGSGTRVSVPVHLSFSHSSGTGTLTAVVANGTNGWRIDNFVYPGIGDLRSTIQKALK